MKLYNRSHKKYSGQLCGTSCICQPGQLLYYRSVIQLPVSSSDRATLLSSRKSSAISAVKFRSDASCGPVGTKRRRHAAHGRTVAQHIGHPKENLAKRLPQTKSGGGRNLADLVESQMHGRSGTLRLPHECGTSAFGFPLLRAINVDRLRPLRRVGLTKSPAAAVSVSASTNDRLGWQAAPHMVHSQRQDMEGSE